MMEPRRQALCTAFAGERCLATGHLADVVRSAKSAQDRGEPVLIFDDESGEPIEVDFRGTEESVLERLPVGEPRAEDTPKGPGRPKLGVVGREVTLLPRHWDWLNSQPGGASVALRKLVEEARRANAGKDRRRRAQEAAYRFMSAMAGNLTGFEETCRAFFAGDSGRFQELTEAWPPDIRDHARRMAEDTFETA
ncbi:MAG TPA: DUF2239 family protein [Isosphaeraceae bacterium]|nr:DUF2239 family protein [Isosphaeraceae bacterium]